MNKLTKKQMKIMESTEHKKLKRKLQQSSSNETEVTKDMIDELSIRSKIDRMNGLLPQPIRFRYITSPTPNRSQFRKIWTKMPFKSRKDHILWVFDDRNGFPLSLTKEIKQFHEYVSLRDHEVEARKRALVEIEDAIKSKWSEAVIHVFGSYAVGLSTYVSDLDISILGLDGLEVLNVEGPNHYKETVDLTLDGESSEGGDEGDGGGPVTWEINRDRSGANNDRDHTTANTTREVEQSNGPDNRQLANDFKADTGSSYDRFRKDRPVSNGDGDGVSQTDTRTRASSSHCTGYEGDSASEDDSEAGGDVSRYIHMVWSSDEDDDMRYENKEAVASSNRRNGSTVPGLQKGLHGQKRVLGPTDRGTAAGEVIYVCSESDEDEDCLDISEGADSCDGHGDGDWQHGEARPPNDWRRGEGGDQGEEVASQRKRARVVIEEQMDLHLTTGNEEGGYVGGGRGSTDDTPLPPPSPLAPTDENLATASRATSLTPSGDVAKVSPGFPVLNEGRDVAVEGASTAAESQHPTYVTVSQQVSGGMVLTKTRIIRPPVAACVGQGGARSRTADRQRDAKFRTKVLDRLRALFNLIKVTLDIRLNRRNDTRHPPEQTE